VIKAPKIVLAGSRDVGKTSIFDKLKSNIFKEYSLPTTSSFFVNFALHGTSTSDNITLFDTAGGD
jgi:GTPase SAR1 family protein